MAVGARPRNKKAATAARGIKTPKSLPKLPVGPAETYSWRPILQTGDTTQQFYANFAEVNTTPFELIITLGVMPGRFNLPDLDRISRNEPVTITSTAQIVIPMGFVPHLMQAIY